MKRLRLFSDASATVRFQIYDVAGAHLHHSGGARELTTLATLHWGTFSIFRIYLRTWKQRPLTPPRPRPPRGSQATGSRKLLGDPPAQAPKGGPDIKACPTNAGLGLTTTALARGAL